MDPFTQRMLERARARQEKIDQKLANSGQVVPKRKPLAENVGILKTESSPVQTPAKIAKDSVISPKRSINSAKSPSNVKSPNRRSSKLELPVASPKARSDVIVTRKEFKSPRNSKGSLNRRNSDVSVEINITHRNDIQIEVQVEERDAPIDVTYDTHSDSGSSVTIKEIEEHASNNHLEKQSHMSDNKTDRGALRNNFKSRLDRLGNLYSDKPTLSSPIHRTEQNFNAATPPSEPARPKQPAPEGKKKFGRLAALADQINNWEDDLTHHNIHNPEPTKKGPTTRAKAKNEALESSTLDVSIHSIKDINNILQSTSSKSSQASKVNTRTFTKPASSEAQQLNKQIVAELFLGDVRRYRRSGGGTAENGYNNRGLLPYSKELIDDSDILADISE